MAIYRGESSEPGYVASVSLAICERLHEMLMPLKMFDCMKLFGISLAVASQYRRWISQLK